MSCSRWTNSCNRRPCYSRDSIVEAQNKNLDQFCASAKEVANDACTLKKSVDTGCKPCSQSNNQASSTSRPCIQPRKPESYSCRPCGRSSKPETSECIQTITPMSSNNLACSSTKSSSESVSCIKKFLPACSTGRCSENVETGACSGKVVASNTCSTGQCSRATTQLTANSKNVCVVAPEKNLSLSQETRPRAGCCANRNAAVGIPCRSVPLLEPTTRGSCNISGKGCSSLDTLAIGTYVHIVAIQDKFRPAGQTSIQKIAAVVMYATSDGLYQLGTRKGVIGKLFTRDELDVKDYKKFTIKDVPDTRINMYEASTIAF